MDSEGLTWPDNRPLYDVAGQADFLLDPVTTLAPDDPIVLCLKADSNAEVGALESASLRANLESGCRSPACGLQVDAYLREHCPGMQGLLSMSTDDYEFANDEAASKARDKILEWEVTAVRCLLLTRLACWEQLCPCSAARYSTSGLACPGALQDVCC